MKKHSAKHGLIEKSPSGIRSYEQNTVPQTKRTLINLIKQLAELIEALRNDLGLG